jgi:hypothetical protein
MVFDVRNSAKMVGRDFFVANKKSQEWYWNISPKMQSDIAASYTGCMLEAFIVNSSARKKGLNTAQPEYSGQVIRMFTQESAGKCEQFLGKRFEANLQEICCDGREESPCLYKTSLRASGTRNLGPAGGNRGNRETEQAIRSKDYQAGLNFMKNGDYRQAARSLELAKKAGNFDLSGTYFLALAYRNLERCEKVIKLLTPMQVKWERSEFWATEEVMIRKSVFLLARCYSMSNDPSRSSVILNSYLSDPKKYKEEIYGARSHEDFGWIRTTKEFREFYEASNKIRFE